MSKTLKLKPILNQADIQLLSKYFASKDDLEQIIDQKLSEKIGILPTKDEFYSQMDQIMGELKSIREEQIVLTQHDQDQNDRLDNLEFLHSSSHSHFSKS